MTAGDAPVREAGEHEIVWTEEARRRVENAPLIVRPGILKLMVKRARERGRTVGRGDPPRAGRRRLRRPPRERPRWWPAIVALARAYGADGIRVERPGDLAGALEHAIKADAPFVLDVHVDRDIRPPAVGTSMACRTLMAGGG